MVTWGVEALYANPFDPEAYGHAIAAILQHPRVADQLARFGSQKARARFTWNGVAQQVLGVLQAVECAADDLVGGGAVSVPATVRRERERAEAAGDHTTAHQLLETSEWVLGAS
jgi:hypothetical protein